MRFPDRDCPIADETAEAVGFPAIEGGSDDGNVGRVSFEIAAQIGNQRGPIVETAIPCKDKAPLGEIRPLRRDLAVVEGTYRSATGTVHIARFVVRTLLLQELAHLLDWVQFDWPAVEIPNACLCTLISIS